MLIIPVLLAAAAAAAYLCRWQWMSNLPVLGGIVLHVAALMTVLYPKMQLGLGAIVSLFMLGAIAIGWRGLRFERVRRLLLVLAALAAFMPALLPTTADSPTAGIHALLALAAYIFAAVAFLHCLDLRTAERLLRSRPQTEIKPPLLDSERRCFRFVGGAFFLLTLTLISGAITDPEALFRITHKNLFAALTWLTLLVLLSGRKFYGWRGNIAQTGFFIGYAFLLLSYVGSAFVIQVILN